MAVILYFFPEFSYYNLQRKKKNNNIIVVIINTCVFSIQYKTQICNVACCNIICIVYVYIYICSIINKYSIWWVCNRPLKGQTDRLVTADKGSSFFFPPENNNIKAKRLKLYTRFFISLKCQCWVAIIIYFFVCLVNYRRTMESMSLSTSFYLITMVLAI